MNDLLMLIMSGWAIASFVGCFVALLVFNILKYISIKTAKGIKKRYDRNQSN